MASSLRRRCFGHFQTGLRLCLNAKPSAAPYPIPPNGGTAKTDVGFYNSILILINNRKAEAAQKKYYHFCDLILAHDTSLCRDASLDAVTSEALSIKMMRSTF